MQSHTTDIIYEKKMNLDHNYSNDACMQDNFLQQWDLVIIAPWNVVLLVTKNSASSGIQHANKKNTT